MSRALDAEARAEQLRAKLAALAAPPVGTTFYRVSRQTVDGVTEWRTALGYWIADEHSPRTFWTRHKDVAQRAIDDANKVYQPLIHMRAVIVERCIEREDVQ